MSIEIACRTDPGRVRDHNEDNLANDNQLGLVVLADGMGGYQAGEIASKMAVDIIVGELNKCLKTLSRDKRDPHRTYHSATVLLEQAVIKANQCIYECAEQQSHYHGMGTTVVAALFHHHFISIAHVGDSRLYRIRGHELTQLTKDHSVRQELIDCGFYTPEQARHSPNKNLVTRALGVGQKVMVDIQEHIILASDIYLLCSDGLNDMLEDYEIQKIILNHSDCLERAAEKLVVAANSKGGDDNISVMLVRPLEILKSRPTLWQRLLNWWR